MFLIIDKDQIIIFLFFHVIVMPLSHSLE